MPSLVSSLAKEDFRRKHSEVKNIDLSSYFAIITDIQANKAEGGDIELDEGEQQRTVKRRLTAAAKKSGYKHVKWSPSPKPGVIRFRLVA